MAKPILRRFLDRRLASGEAISPGFFARRRQRKKFLAEKDFWLTDLTRALKLAGTNSYSVAPVLRNCLVKLAKLSFAFPWDSNRALYFTRSKYSKYSITPPKGKKYFIYRAPFIALGLDGSKRSLQFWHRLAQLVQRYPRAYVEFPGVNGKFEIMPSMGLRSDRELISVDKLKAKQAEARRFFKDLETIVDEFL